MPLLRHPRLSDVIVAKSEAGDLSVGFFTGPIVDTTIEHNPATGYWFVLTYEGGGQVQVPMSDDTLLWSEPERH